MAQGNAYKTTKEQISYRGPSGDWTHCHQTEAAPPADTCPARSLHATAIVLKNNIPMTCLMLLCFHSINRKTFDTEKDMITGMIYRIPDTDIKDFDVKLSNVPDQIRIQIKMAYLMGDYNINLLNSNTHEHASEFDNILYSNEFLPLISWPTRIISNSAAPIDNTPANCPHNLNSSINGILLTDISDHFPIFHVNRFLTVEDMKCIISQTTRKLLLKLFQKPTGSKYTILLKPRSLLIFSIPNW